MASPFFLNVHVFKSLFSPVHSKELSPVHIIQTLPVRRFKKKTKVFLERQHHCFKCSWVSEVTEAARQGSHLTEGHLTRGLMGPLGFGKSHLFLTCSLGCSRERSWVHSVRLLTRERQETPLNQVQLNGAEFTSGFISHIFILRRDYFMTNILLDFGVVIIFTLLEVYFFYYFVSSCQFDIRIVYIKCCC